jgi:potassium-transporting ATPase potassium-binding subunit
MTATGWLQIVNYGLLVLLITKPLGVYLYRVFEDKNRPLPRGFGLLEQWTFRLCGVNPEKEQNWQEYALALLQKSRSSVITSKILIPSFSNQIIRKMTHLTKIIG